MKNKKVLNIILLSLLSIVFTILVKYVDVKGIGPESSMVGMATINDFFHHLTGVNMSFYKLTDYIGYIPLLMVCGYALIGLLQLIKRKSLLKVDREIIALGVFYVIVIGIYIFFEKVIINYRPVILEEVLEASYPSSHTLLALCLCGSSIILNNKLFKNKYTNIMNIISKIIMIVLVIGRLVSGVHWFTDIIGGIIISVTLLYAFNCVINLEKTTTC